MAKKMQKLRLTLELESPQKTKNGFQVLATAIVSRGWQAAQGRPVIFFRNAEPVGTTTETNENGRVSQIIDISEDITTVSIEAQVVGISTARDRKIVSLKKEGAKRPEEEKLELKRIKLEQLKVSQEIENLTKPTVTEKIYVTFTGENGRQKLLISVSDENGMFIPNFHVKVVDGDEVKSLKTESDGTAVYQMNFTERDRYVEVRAGNEHDLIWRARLNGPTEKKGDK